LPWKAWPELATERGGGRVFADDRDRTNAPRKCAKQESAQNKKVRKTKATNQISPISRFLFLKAGDAIRTRDIHLGKVTLYH
jgi:hypothetical protein